MADPLCVRDVRRERLEVDDVAGLGRRCREQRDEVRAEARAKLEAIFGATPSSEDENDDEEAATPFEVYDADKFAQTPADQAPDQTTDDYSADMSGDAPFGGEE